MDSVIRYDGGSWPEKAELTSQGFLRVDAPITRMGVLHYENADGTSRGELRHPDDWSTPQALASFASLPLTDGHPPGRKSDGQPLVDAANAKRLAIGWTGESVRADGPVLRAPMMIVDAAAVAAVQRGKRGTSTGVVVDLRPEVGVHEGVAYQFRQVNPQGNHIAIVDNPRAGTRIRLDGNQAFDDDAEAAEGDRDMVKIVLDGISYEAAPEVANALARSEKERGDLFTQIAQLRQDGKAALDKVTAERDTFKERLDVAEKRDIRAEVRQRVSLEGAARAVLPQELHARLDEMPDGEIRKAVVAATWPELKLDDKSPEYISTRFDIALEDKRLRTDDDARHEDALAAQRSKIVPRQDSGGNELTDAARKASERIANQWKIKAA